MVDQKPGPRPWSQPGPSTVPLSPRIGIEMMIVEGWRSEVRELLARVPDRAKLHRLASYCFDYAALCGRACPFSLPQGGPPGPAAGSQVPHQRSGPSVVFFRCLTSAPVRAAGSQVPHQPTRARIGNESIRFFRLIRGGYALREADISLTLS